MIDHFRLKYETFIFSIWCATVYLSITQDKTYQIYLFLIKITFFEPASPLLPPVSWVSSSMSAIFNLNSNFYFFIWLIDYLSKCIYHIFTFSIWIFKLFKKIISCLELNSVICMKTIHKFVNIFNYLININLPCNVSIDLSIDFF